MTAGAVTSAIIGCASVGGGGGGGAGGAAARRLLGSTDIANGLGTVKVGDALVVKGRMKDSRHKRVSPYLNRAQFR